MAERRNWLIDEVREALALYLVTDFGRFHSRNPYIIALAEKLGRTPSSIALKLANLAALDDSLPQKGMANASSLDRQVWAEYLDQPDAVIAAFAGQNVEVLRASSMGMAENLAAFDHLGGSRPVQNLQRVGQDLFRRIVLTSYRGRCALTGIDDPRLLTASHILPWSAAPQMRMRPTNGLCLNALHDRAFDRHLISFDTDGRLLLSPRLSANSREQLLLGCKAKLEPPSRFAPDAELMAQHRAQFEALAA